MGTGSVKYSPCIDCEERTVYPNCHDHCIAYKKWKGEKHEIDRKQKEYMIQVHDVAVTDHARYGRRKT